MCAVLDSRAEPGRREARLASALLHGSNSAQQTSGHYLDEQQGRATLITQRDQPDRHALVITA
jgi:hypothetical protein